MGIEFFATEPEKLIGVLWHIYHQIIEI